ncbi:MAG: hypothetical protein PHE67_00260 [Campylobacterales bacterium]|nr:hypothetical protein [Campylobacterales bacterium]
MKQASFLLLITILLSGCNKNTDSTEYEYVVLESKLTDNTYKAESMCKEENMVLAKCSEINETVKTSKYRYFICNDLKQMEVYDRQLERPILPIQAVELYGKPVCKKIFIQ